MILHAVRITIRKDKLLGSNIAMRIIDLMIASGHMSRSITTEAEVLWLHWPHPDKEENILRWAIDTYKVARALGFTVELFRYAIADHGDFAQYEKIADSNIK